VRELYGDAPTTFECAGGDPSSKLCALESVFASSTTIARRFPDLKPVLPGRRATRAYWLVTPDTTASAPSAPSASTWSAA